MTNYSKIDHLSRGGVYLVMIIEWTLRNDKEMKLQ